MSQCCPLQPHLGEENLRPAAGEASLRSHREAIREPRALEGRKRKEGNGPGGGGKALQFRVWAIGPRNVSQERTYYGPGMTVFT